MQVNLFGPEVSADPYSFFEAARSEGPVVRNDNLGFWMVTDHAEAVEVLRSPAVFSSSAMRHLGSVGAAMAANSMSAADPPEHGRLRSVVQRAFTPRAVAQFGPRVAALADGVLDPLGPGDVLDAVNDLSYLVSITVIADLLGVSGGDRQVFQQWSDELLAGGNLLCPPNVQEKAEKAAGELSQYFREQIADRRDHPTDGDLLGRLVAANEDDTLTETEMIASCILLLFAGHETTTKLIGNSIHVLTQFPGERRRLVGDPTLMGTAVEEFLRFVGPPQGQLRSVMEDTVLAGTALTAGDIVLVLPGCANRDPKEFADPNVLDVGRDPNRHIQFGHGAHFCLGASLARLETSVTLTRLLAKGPNYQLDRPDDPLEYAPVFFMRGLTRLDIRL
jgi:cytochrome P450